MGKPDLILDTCALLWLAAGREELSEEARERIEECSAVYVSAISLFEIGLKCKAAKLRLPMPPEKWFDAVVLHHDLTALSLDWKICLASTELPPVHRDPCDRFLIATAQAYDLCVVTGDPIFREYGIRVLA